MFKNILIVALILTYATVDSKLAECKNRFVRKMTHDYCTKFGIQQHATMKVHIRSKLTNVANLKPRDDVEDVKVEIAILKDQEYERIQKLDKATCEDYREVAVALWTSIIPFNGHWSDKYANIETTQEASVFAINRPTIYYVEVLDCKNELLGVFNTGSFPKLIHEVHFTTQNGKNEFSYEDMGLLRLYTILLILLGALYVMLILSFRKFYQVEQSCVAPHPMIIIGLTFQMTAMLFQVLHLWMYSNDGRGNVLCDILSKILQSFSETTISLLLITLASGWKLRFQEIDFDDSVEVYLPMTALVLVIQVLLAALTFVDVDASHKYHDFAGVQGWCLFGMKTILFLYFAYCIWDSKNQAKKNQTQLSYLRSLFSLGAAYLLAIPASVIITFIYEPYERQYVFTLVSEMAMFGANVAMFYMLSSSKSSYRRTSTDDVGLPHRM